MSHDLEYAKRIFVHYFQLLAIRAGVAWAGDNISEIEGAVESLVKAATPAPEPTKAPKIREATVEEEGNIILAFMRYADITPEETANRDVFIRDHYITDCPGYVGPVAFIHWHGGPGNITILVKRDGAQDGGWEVEVE